MDLPLPEKIIADLKKSGFASELECFEILARNQWISEGGSSYYDKDEHKIRNIDIGARYLRQKNQIKVECVLAIEVKKSEKPWIVLGGRNREYDGLENPFNAQHLPVDLGKIIPSFQVHSIRLNLFWLGYNVHESFKEPNDSGRWFSAAVTVSKFASSYFEDQPISEPSLFPAQIFQYIQPLVVLDGKLFRTVVNPQISVEEIGYAPMTFEYGSLGYPRRTYRVDLVTLGALDKYLDLLKHRTDEIFDEIITG